MVFEEAQLYTDGSTITEGSIGDFLRGTETTRSTGAVVGTDDGDTYAATRLDFVSSKLTPYLTELTTLLFARLRSHLTARVQSRRCKGPSRVAAPRGSRDTSQLTTLNNPYLRGLRHSGLSRTRSWTRTKTGDGA